MNGTYQEGEPKQEIQITIRFNTKMNPGSDFHLKTILKNGVIHISGEKLYEENGRLVYEIG